MRSATLVVLPLATTLFFTVAVVGQQDEVFVHLPPEPEPVVIPATLPGAAAANDFATFDALYRSSPDPRYAELHRLWAWSMEDRVGAFFGPAAHDRLARMYPGFETYIADFSIVDSHGNVFYPTAETRRFLASRAADGVLAQATPARVTPRPAAVAAVAPRAAPAPSRAEPVPVAAAVSQPAPAPVLTLPAPVPEEPTVIAAAITAAPRLIPVAAAESVRGRVRHNEAQRGALSRSIFLMIAGLLGVGMLSVMLHAPRDEHDPRLTR